MKVPTKTEIKGVLSVAFVEVLQFVNILQYTLLLNFHKLSQPTIRLPFFPCHMGKNCSITPGATFCHLALRGACERAGANDRHACNASMPQKVPLSTKRNLSTMTQHRRGLQEQPVHWLSGRSLEHTKKFRMDVNNYRSHQMVLIAGAIFFALICIGLTYRRNTQARRTASQLKEMIYSVANKFNRRYSGSAVIIPFYYYKLVAQL